MTRKTRCPKLNPDSPPLNLSKQKKKVMWMGQKPCLLLRMPLNACDVFMACNDEVTLQVCSLNGTAVNHYAIVVSDDTQKHSTDDRHTTPAAGLAAYSPAYTPRRGKSSAVGHTSCALHL